MKKLVFLALVVLLAACASDEPTGSKEVKVKEVHQAGEYTYLLVKAKGPEYWVAVPAMEAKVGETYYYEGGLLMTDFRSETLDKTFETVLFVGRHRLRK